VIIINKEQFVEEDYLNANSDVAAAVKAGAFKNGYEHYQKHGKKEGRTPSGGSHRENAVFNLINKQGLGLEIGPSHNPIAPKKKGFKVHILDHVSADDLRAKYQGHGLNLENIESVDFVWQGQPLPELVGKTHCYDWIIASHVVEHIPDLISFLQQCEQLLKLSGVISLVIPDKRYCFDYFNSLSSTGMLLDAFEQKRTRPSAGQVFDHFANASKCNDSIAWSKNQPGGADSLIHSFSEAYTHYKRSIETNEYIDVHCWRFTPESFSLILSDLALLGVLNLEIKAQFPTSGCEFYVSLGLISDLKRTSSDRLNALKNI
jgi:hypothetical protein